MLQMHIGMHLQLMGNGQDGVVGKQVADNHRTDRLRLEVGRRLRRAAPAASLLRHFEFVRDHHARVPGLGIGPDVGLGVADEKMRSFI